MTYPFQVGQKLILWLASGVPTPSQLEQARIHHTSRDIYNHMWTAANMSWVSSCICNSKHRSIHTKNYRTITKSHAQGFPGVDHLILTTGRHECYFGGREVMVQAVRSAVARSSCTFTHVRYVGGHNHEDKACVACVHEMIQGYLRV